MLAAADGDPVGPHHVGCNVTEMNGVHIHAKLNIIAHGRAVAVPANVGFVLVGGTPVCLYWLHTHDDSGIIHVEAPGGSYTLADFFAVWGEPLSATRLGPYRGRVRAFVDGALYSGPPQDVELSDGETILLNVE
jgi:hypothetical protein